MSAAADAPAHQTDTPPMLASLNEEQRAAVTTSSNHALVLAGAGSGKTRVLTHRIAWLCGVKQVSPYRIVAATFTNKAAREMRSRVETLLGASIQGMWIGTFHGLCNRFLRKHWREAGIKQAFQVLDATDQKRLVKRVTTALDLDPEKWPVGRSQWFINSHKEKGMRADTVQAENFASRELLRIYTAYEEACQRASLLDFAELLLRVVELLRGNNDLRQSYHERFRTILVDEFQDTNTLQYAWLRHLAGEQTSVFVVGDDDQSIYGWRGARVENMHSFGKDFPEAETYRLEQNYRSTPTILNAANSMIGNNQGRLGKHLWTDRKSGDPILFYAALDEWDEARFAADTIEAWTRKGRPHGEVAILYRSNAQSRVIETQLRSGNIAYQVYGGLRFFDRTVIKDALAYLKIAINPDDDQSFERIINVPPRGIGDRTLEAIQAAALTDKTSLLEAGQQLIREQSLPTRALNALKGFYNIIDRMKDLRQLTPREAVEKAIKASGLLDYHRNRNTMEGDSNVENLEEFISAAEGADKSREAENDLNAVSEFLARVVLESGEGGNEPAENCVQLMTLHAAKGLEFPLVLILGMEENLFPHVSAIRDTPQLEEERRLCYVGVTRAQEQLVLVYARRRKHLGRETFNEPSRFIDEIPHALIEEIRPRLQVNLPPASRHGRSPETGAEVTHAGGKISTGTEVSHSKFGRGIVIACEGAGSSARVQVRFEKTGTKWLVLSYANLVEVRQ